MRMVKKIGLALMVLALLVSCVDSAMAAWPDEDITNVPSSADVFYGFSNDLTAASYREDSISRGKNEPRIRLVKTETLAIDEARKKVKEGKNIIVISAYTDYLSLDILSGDYRSTVQNTIQYEYNAADTLLILSADYDGAAASADISGDVFEGFKRKLEHPGLPVIGKLPSAGSTEIGYFGFGIRLASISEKLSDFVISRDDVSTPLKITIDGVYTPGSGWDEYWSATVQGGYVAGLRNEDFNIAPEFFGQTARVVGVQLVNDSVVNGNYQYQLTVQSEEYVRFKNDFTGLTNPGGNAPGTRRYILNFKDNTPLTTTVTLDKFRLALNGGSTAALPITLVSGTTYYVDADYKAGLVSADFVPTDADSTAATVDPADNGSTAKTYTVTVTPAGGTAVKYTLNFKDTSVGPPAGPTNPVDLDVILHPGSTNYADIEYDVLTGTYHVDADYSSDAKFYFNGAEYSATKNDANKTWAVTIGGTSYTILFNDSGITPPRGGSSGGGCDAGFGALGLMVLAGSAMVLRKKK
ncbi:hypothetical protein FACS1894216_15700 [Synergistales bacterium]|nr:hypothetical protein FACS1894216_15700 [Synergistales bacterium]